MQSFTVFARPGETLTTIGDPSGFGTVESVNFDGSICARKRLSPHSIEAEGIERFNREIETLKRIRSPYIVNILHHGEYKFDPSCNPLPFYIMPLAEYSFREYISNYPWSQEPEKLIARLCETALALGYMHSREVVHRDLKPENILIFERGACLCDFGLAKNMNANKTGAFETNFQSPVLHTPGFSAPEQKFGLENCGSPSDVYSFGCVLYRIMSGELPGIPGRELNSEIDRRFGVFADFLKKCLSYEQSDRYQDGYELAEAFFQLVLNPSIVGSMTIQVDPEYFPCSLSDAAVHGYPSMLDTWTAMYFSLSLELKTRLPYMVDNSNILALVSGAKRSNFFSVVKDFTDVIFKSNETWAFVDVVGQFFRSITDAAFVLLGKSTVRDIELEQMVIFLSQSLAVQAHHNNRFDGGREFIRMFSQGGELRREILTKVVAQMNPAVYNWLGEEVNVNLMYVDNDVANMLKLR